MAPDISVSDSKPEKVRRSMPSSTFTACALYHMRERLGLAQPLRASDSPQIGLSSASNESNQVFTVQFLHLLKEPADSIFFEVSGLAMRG